MTRSEAIKAFSFKSVLPVTVALILYCIFKSACVKNGELDYVWLWILCGLPFGLHRMCLWIVPGGTAECQASATHKNSAGENQPRHLRGLLLISSTTFCKASSLSSMKNWATADMTKRTRPPTTAVTVTARKRRKPATERLRSISLVTVKVNSNRSF